MDAKNAFTPFCYYLLPARLDFPDCLASNASFALKVLWPRLAMHAGKAKKSFERAYKPMFQSFEFKPQGFVIS